jgi:formyl-CoA transferase
VLTAPTKVRVDRVDVLTSKDAVIGILVALNERHVSGAGQHVEVISYRACSARSPTSRRRTWQQVSLPDGWATEHPSIAPYETLRCQDGIIAV